jgi:hypothetical protein
VLGDGRAAHMKISCDSADCLLAAAKNVQDFPSRGIRNRTEDNVIFLCLFVTIRLHAM